MSLSPNALNVFFVLHFGILYESGFASSQNTKYSDDINKCSVSGPLTNMKFHYS